MPIPPRICTAHVDTERFGLTQYVPADQSIPAPTLLNFGCMRREGHLGAHEAALWSSELGTVARVQWFVAFDDPMPRPEAEGAAS